MGDDEGVHHNFCHLLPSLFGRLLSALVVLLSEGLFPAAADDLLRVQSLPVLAQQTFRLSFFCDFLIQSAQPTGCFHGYL